MTNEERYRQTVAKLAAVLKPPEPTMEKEDDLARELKETRETLAREMALLRAQIALLIAELRRYNVAA